MGCIKYRLDSRIHLNAALKEKRFRVNFNNIVIFGDENLTEYYEFLIIHVRRLELETREYLAGLSLETTQINFNLPNCFDDRRKAFVTSKAKSKSSRNRIKIESKS